MRQHPLEYCEPTDRFVVLLQVGMMTKQGGPAFEALSYGLPGQPAPDTLLRRGHRATSFATEGCARMALKDSAEEWERDGLTFHHGKQIAILKVETV
jgi:hypothetical protein